MFSFAVICFRLDLNCIHVIMLCFRLLYIIVLTSNVDDVCVCVCACTRMRVFVHGCVCGSFVLFSAVEHVNHGKALYK